MTSDFKREFKLKQHSHLIHFQYTHPDACLRATELKPKLDRFLIEHHFKNDRSKYVKLLVGYSEKVDEKKLKDALNYKVSISAKKRERHDYEYKGMGGDDLPHGIFHEETTISIFSFESELLTAIDTWMERFLVLNNFGFRQSKGFGCFTLEDPCLENFEGCLREQFAYFWKADLNKIKGIWLGKIYNFIRGEYQKLKGGQNFKLKIKNKKEQDANGKEQDDNQEEERTKKVYVKSRLFEYMEKKNVIWEKRKIKETLSQKHHKLFKNLLRTNNLNDEEPEAISEEQCYRYIRALLGLAEHNEYRMSKGKDLLISIDDSAYKIKRFQSPLMFKIFENYVYILPRPIPDEMFDRKFKFILKGVPSPDKKGRDSELFELSTPSADEFSMERFLDHALDGSDWEREPRNG